jgi:hypothetical protein
MADANAPLEFSGDAKTTVGKLGSVMQVVAGVLLLTAVVNIAGGVSMIAQGSFLGVLALIEGAVSGLLGLIMLSSSADVRYMVETPYTGIHLGNAFRNLTVFYQAQFGLAIFLVVVAVAGIFAG